MFGAVIIFGFQRLENEFLDAQRQIDINLSVLQDERNSLEDKVNERTIKLTKLKTVWPYSDIHSRP